MAQRVIVRFSECEGYDINRDAMTCRFMATTAHGSFWTEVEVEGPRGLRNDRQAFKDQVVELIRAGADPQYVALEAMEH